MKAGGMEYCHFVYWEGDLLKKGCVNSQPLNQQFPDAELIPIARVLCSIEEGPLPVSIRGCSPLLLRVLSENSGDSRQFVVSPLFDGDSFLQCFRQAHEGVFGMVELVTLIEYIVCRMKSALYEEWKEDKFVLRRCIQKGAVAFDDLSDLLGELIELWPPIKPYIRCTGLPHAKDTADNVSSIIFSICWYCSIICVWGIICFSLVEMH